MILSLDTSNLEEHFRCVQDIVKRVIDYRLPHKHTLPEFGVGDGYVGHEDIYVPGLDTLELFEIAQLESGPEGLFRPTEYPKLG